MLPHLSMQVCLPLFTLLPFPPRSTMLPANLLLLMVLLLPQVSSGRQGGDASQPDHGRASPVPSSLPTPPAAPRLKPSLAETIQSLLLSRLGLQAQPDPRPGVPVPRYLLDLYRFHQQQYHLVEDPLFNFPRQHIQQANTVRSFHHNGELSHKEICITDLLHYYLLHYWTMTSHRRYFCSVLALISFAQV